jgi:ElaB/YqjD/DUF883 family membrane-anchored ribosome-binding protein
VKLVVYIKDGKTLGGMAERGKDLLEDVSEWGLDDVADEVKAYVKKNPLKSLGIAVGIGFVLSSLLSSSRGDE